MKILYKLRGKSVGNAASAVRWPSPRPPGLQAYLCAGGLRANADSNFCSTNRSRTRESLFFAALRMNDLVRVIGARPQ